MKKSRLIFAAVFCLSSFSISAQFLSAIGAAIGVSYGKEMWSKEQWLAQERYMFGLNGAVLAEFFSNPNFQWRSELMCNQLGVKEMVMNTYYNQTQYLSFNNYLKCSYPLDNFAPYILIGPRLEYLFNRGAAIFPDAIAGMHTFHLTGAVGVGAEVVWFSRVRPFVEFFYNRDIMPSFNGKVLSNDPYPPLNGTFLSEIINAQDFELRVGLKYLLKKRPECPHVDNSAGNPPGAQ